MLRAGALLLALLAACSSDNKAAVDAAAVVADAGPIVCSATFAGNFDETSSGMSDCATVVPGTGDASTDQVLTLMPPSTMLATSFAITVDLGPTPSADTFSSETITTWNSLAIKTIGAGGCAYSAGNTSVPTGSFTLTIDSIDPASATAHGSLSIIAYVQALLNTDCGAGDNETISITF